MAHGPVPGPDAVLLVDGNEVSRAARARTLRDAGLAVREAAGGREALRLLADGPDLLVLDGALPDLDGAEVCRRVKSGPGTGPWAIGAPPVRGTGRPPRRSTGRRRGGVRMVSAEWATSSRRCAVSARAK